MAKKTPNQTETPDEPTGKAGTVWQERRALKQQKFRFSDQLCDNSAATGAVPAPGSLECPRPGWTGLEPPGRGEGGPAMAGLGLGGIRGPIQPKPDSVKSQRIGTENIQKHGQKRW